MGSHWAPADILVAVSKRGNFKCSGESGAGVSALHWVSCAVQVSSRHADLLQRWTSPRPAAGQPAAGRRVDHAAGSSSVSPCSRTCSDGAGHVAQADASADVPATPALAGHPSLTLKVKGEQGRGPRGFDGEVGCGWRERASATGSPSHSLSPAKRPHTPHQSKLSTDTVSGSHS